MNSRLSLWKRIVSYITPVPIEQDDKDSSQPLELVLVRGRYHLLTTNTIYSSSLEYRPFSETYPFMYQDNPLPESVLFLGGGLGSGLEILNKKYGNFPRATVVELNPIVTQWAKEYVFPQDQKTNWIQEDAEKFLPDNTEKFDLIGVDLFNKLEPLDCIYHEDFILNLKKSCNPKAFVIINTILPKDFDIQVYLNMLSRYFKIHTTLQEGISHYIVLRHLD